MSIEMVSANESDLQVAPAPVDQPAFRGSSYDRASAPDGSKDLPIEERRASKDIENVGKIQLKDFSYGFTSPELASLRREYTVIMLRVVGLIIILMWACLPVYWGSLADSGKLTNNLDAWFVDRDDSRIGHTLWSVFGNTSALGPQLNWNFVVPTVAGSDDDIAQAVVNEQAWIAVVIHTNATSHLSTARECGNASYNPASAITVYYNQARFATVVSTSVLPFTTTLLQESTTAFATSAAQLYFAQIYAQGTVNATALQLLAQAPQTISPAISWTMVNVRPYTAPVALAVTLVGNIFLCIFAFISTMAHATARALIQRHLRFSSYLTLRLAVPLIIYLPLSLSYAMVSLAFKLPFGAKYNYASGFFLFFVYIYLGMAALGLALEAVITLLTPRFIPFFLFCLIIINISAAVEPNELQPSFFMYSDGFPVWNISQAINTIIFNTRSYLGRNAGVLFGWILLSIFTISLFTWFIRRREKAAAGRGRSLGSRSNTAKAK